MSSDGTRRPGERPAFYALTPGGWRDYWTLLHPPYTLWHLSYVVMGAVDRLDGACPVAGGDADRVLPGHGRRRARARRAARKAARNAHPRRGALGARRRGSGGGRGARRRRHARGLALDLGVHRRGRVPGRGVQPRAARRTHPLRPVVRPRMGRVPGPHRVVRADRSRRARGGRARLRMRGDLGGATRALHTGPAAATAGRGRRGNDHAARRRRRDDRCRDPSIGARASAQVDVARDAAPGARPCCSRGSRASRRPSWSSRPRRRTGRSAAGRAPRTRSRTASAAATAWTRMRPGA